MIVTQRKEKIPLLWIILITLPVFADSLSEWCGMTAMTFSIRKFVDFPPLITFLHSFNFAFNFMVVPVVAWYSDRIWTRFGRRKPFILVGWAGMVVVQLFLPMAPNIWMLGILIVIFHFLVDCAITGPYEPLIYEVIPQKQRGLGGAMRSFFSLSSNMVFSFFLLGLFDNQYSILGGITISGEHVIYWTLAAVQFSMIIFLFFFVRETPVPAQKPIEHFNPIRYFKQILSQRQWVLLYAVVFCQVAMIKGLGELEALLVTDQFGYSKAEFGYIRGFVGITQISISILAAITVFADRFDRLKIFMTGVFLSTLYPVVFYCYVKSLPAGQVPPLTVIIVFDCFKFAVNVGGSIALMPMLFDYIPKNKMSTMYSGTIFIRGVSQILIANGMAWYVAGYSKYIAHIPEGQKWDYMSGCHFLFVLNLVACVIVVYFYKQRQKGKLTEYGKLGIEEE